MAGFINNKIKNRDFLTPTQMIVFSFLIIISLGTMLLLLPWATPSHSLSFLEALFTAVSATCVTGLTVIDIGTELTYFGQSVVLVLIQLGGLGIMTFSTFFIYLLGRRASLRNQEVIDTTLSYMPVQNIGSLLKKIMLIVFTIEGAGVLLLTFWWLERYSFLKALYHGIFHSVSAFCNAGFSLYTTSFEKYQSDVYFNGVIMGLIILGGLGFIVLMEFKYIIHRSKNIIHHFSFHTKVVLSVTGFLIIAGTVLIFWVEKPHILGQFSTGRGFLMSLFQSVTARTAGFNTLNIGALTNGACFILMFLMFFGAAPGSCGGGVKVSTLGIIVAMVLSRIKGQEEPNLFSRTIPREMVGKALTIVLGAVFIIGLVFFALLLTEDWMYSPSESRGDFIKLLFEAISAFGTVGLSMGITPQLSQAGRVLIILLMFIGRLGPLTLAVALTRTKSAGRYRYAKGEIMVG